jgi:hypothetical protein
MWGELALLATTWTFTKDSDLNASKNLVSGARQEYSHVCSIATRHIRRTVGGPYGHIPACLNYF